MKNKSSYNTIMFDDLDTTFYENLKLIKNGCERRGVDWLNHFNENKQSIVSNENQEKIFLEFVDNEYYPKK